VRVSEHWHVLPREAASLHPWRYSKAIWTQSWATGCRWPCLSLDQMTSTGPFQFQPSCDCNSVTGNKAQAGPGRHLLPHCWEPPSPTWTLRGRRKRDASVLQMWLLWISSEFNYNWFCFVLFCCVVFVLQSVETYIFYKTSLFKYYRIFSQGIIACRHQVRTEEDNYGITAQISKQQDPDSLHCLFKWVSTIWTLATI